MSATISRCGQSARAKYAHLRRLRTIQNASLLLMLLASMAIGFLSLSPAAVTALYGLSIGASIVGVVAILAQWRADARYGGVSSRHRESSR